MDVDKIIADIGSATNIRFSRLVNICKQYFGEPRTKGSHHIFKTPWLGDPRINLQEEKGGMAKPYQIKQVIQALQRLKEQENKHGG